MTIAYRTTMHRSAVFSPCRTWRYTLSRIWQRDHPLMTVIGLNPSTADETRDDPTIRRCQAFAQQWGYGGLLMTNLFAGRSTDPKALAQMHDPIGPANDDALRDACRESPLVLAAWGAHPAARGRADQVTKILQGVPLVCLGRTKGGAPRHPLFVAQCTPYEPYP